MNMLLKFMSATQRKKQEKDEKNESNKAQVQEIENVMYTEAGHIYMSPKNALIAILKGQTNWCTSNFLRGLFMLKMLIACFCGILCAAIGLNPYNSSFLFLFISLIATFYIIQIKYKIDVKQAFHSYLKPYIHRLHYAYLAYFSAYVFYNYMYQQLQSYHL